MEHLEVLKTNLAALEASLARLEARKNLKKKHQRKVLELRIIADSIRSEVEKYS